MAEQDLAMQVLQQVVKLPVVKVDRSKFLVDKFSKELDPQDIPTLLEQGATSLLSQETLDRTEVHQGAVDDESNELSFLYYRLISSMT